MLFRSGHCPPPSGASQPGSHSYRGRHVGLGSGCMAASKISERDWGSPIATRMVLILHCGYTCDTDWRDHILRCALAARPLLDSERRYQTLSTVIVEAVPRCQIRRHSWNRPGTDSTPRSRDFLADIGAVPRLELIKKYQVDLRADFATAHGVGHAPLGVGEEF